MPRYASQGKQRRRAASAFVAPATTRIGDVTIGEGASIRRGPLSLVAGGAVVTEGQEIPAGALAAGAPAEVKKRLDGSALARVESAAEEYRQLKDRYRRGGVRVPERPDEPEEGGLAVW